MENIKLRRRNDLTGQRFGRLLVMGAGSRRTKSGGMYWICRCDCGVVKEVSAQALRLGSTVSCGCYNKEYLENNIKHGHNRKQCPKSGTYKSWDKMIQRCNNPNACEYKWYGGKGVSVCERWKDFTNFLSDMGERPNGKSIDRINVRGNYEPSNCRWASTKQQANNTRRNVKFEHNGEMKTISELADIAGIEYDTMYYRIINYKWPISAAMETPVSRKNSLKKILKRH